MKRWLILMLSVLLFWGAATACSGGGGGGGAPAGGGTESTTGGGLGGNDSTLPTGGVKLPDGSIQLPDGTIRKPDGSVVDTNGIVKKQDGTVIFPDGTITLPDGTMKLPNGAIAKTDGTIISAAPKGPELKLPGSTVGDTKVEVIVPTASISGVTDGQLLGTLQATTVTAEGSTDAVSYLWTLDGSGIADDKRTSTENSFQVKLPEVSGSTAVPYTLSLQVKSKSGHTSERKITINAMPKPVLAIENGAGVADGGAWPINTVAAFIPGDVQFNPVLSWGVTANGASVPFTKGVLTLDAGSKDQIIFKPAAAGAYIVTLKGVNGSGESTKTFTLNVKDIPTSVIAGVTQNQKVGNNVELSAAQSTSGVSYAWKLFKSGEGSPFKSANTVTWSPQPGPGKYTATLQVTDDEINKAGSLVSVDFEVVHPPKAVISGIEDGKVYPVDASTVVKLDSDKSEYVDGAEYMWTVEVTEPGGTPGVDKLAQSFYSTTFSNPATYKATLTITTIGGSDSATVEFSAINKAVGKISGIMPGYSYRKAELPVTASGSTDATEYVWSLKKGNTEEASFPHAGADIVVTPQDFGIYTLDLIAGNALGGADPVSVAFNVRPNQPMQMMPFDLSQNTTTFALNEKDVYVGSSTRLFHIGADLQPVQVVEAPISAIWARSSNEVFAGTAGGIYRYTIDGGGWQNIASNKIPAGGLVSLSGAGKGILYAVTAEGKAIKSTDDGDTWNEPSPGNLFKLTTATPDGTVYAVTNTGAVVDGTGGSWSALANGELATALYVKAAGEAYVAANSGKIYYYSKTEKDFSLFYLLPKVIVSGVLVQGYAKAVWKENGAESLHAITQNGHHYVISSDGTMANVTTGDLAVESVSGGATRVAVGVDGNAYKLTNGKWEILTPIGDDALSIKALQGTVSGVDYRPGARVAGDSLVLFNMLSNNGSASLVQKIGANGGRTLISIDYWVLDVWGGSGNDVYVLAQRNADRKIFHYNGSVVTEFMSATLPNSELISAISGIGESLRYVATNKQIYELGAGKAIRVIWENAATDVNFRTLWVAPNGTVYGGTENGLIVAVTSGGGSSVANIGGDNQDAIHQILGASDAQIYATTDSKVFKMGQEGWTEIPLPDNASGFKPHHIAIVSPTEVYFAGDSGLLHVINNSAQLVSSEKFDFIAHAGQFTYIGTTDATSNNVTLNKFGPMQ